MAGQTPLVGRTDELKSLTATITGGFGVTVEGPAGMGKTSLIRQAATELADQFALVPVSATQASQAIPLGALSGHLIDAPAAADDLTRVQEALLGQAMGRPLLVVVDDGHLLDDYSAVAIHQLAVTGKALVLATAREDHRASSAFESLVGQGLSERLVLTPLDHAGVEAMMTAQLRGPIYAPLVQDAWLASRGVPMVVAMVVESGVREGTIALQHGLWTRVGPLTAEPRLLSLIGDQLDHLSSAERSAVDVLALAEPLESAIVDHLVPREVITSLRRKGLVVGVDSDGDTALRLVHPLFGEAARQGITDEQRRATIAALAQTLETAEDTDADMLLRVAMWGAAAECRLDPDLMVRAAAVVRTRSVDSAIRLLRAALVAGAAPPVLLELVRSLVLVGRVAEAEALLLEFDPEGLTPRERVAACTSRAVGLIWTVQRPEAALSLVDLERSACGHDPQLSAMLDAVESGAHLILGDVDSATRTGMRALAGPDIGPEAAVMTAVAVGVAMTQQGRADAALAITAEWLGAAEQIRSSAPPLNASLRGARFEALYYGGRLATLAAEAESAFAQAVEDGDECIVSRTSHYLSRVALLGARPAQAVRHLRDALVALDGFDRMFVAWNLAHLAGALALSGATGEARLMLDQCDAAGPMAAIFTADRAPRRGGHPGRRGPGGPGRRAIGHWGQRRHGARAHDDGPVVLVRRRPPGPHRRRIRAHRPATGRWTAGRGVPEPRGRPVRT